MAAMVVAGGVGSISKGRLEGADDLAVGFLFHTRDIRTPAAEAGLISGLAVCLKAYPDTKRDSSQRSSAVPPKVMPSSEA
jgi:hypothetical protein